jgi:hypothetical protein
VLAERSKTGLYNSLGTGIQFGGPVRFANSISGVFAKFH